MRTLHYNFDNMYSVYEDIITNDGRATNEHLSRLKRELNKFFKDSTCKMVYFTDNTDQMFFGMRVIAKINPDDIYDYLVGEEDIRISNYLLELDSKLFNPVMDLTPAELIAINLHEVGHLVNDTTAITNARNFLASYLADNKDTLAMTDSIHYKEILAFGLKDFLSKDRSIFYTPNDEEILADEFVRAYGYGNYLESAINKIIRSQQMLYAGENVDKFTTFAWILRVYKGLRFRRVGALRTLAKAKMTTASKLEKMEFENVARRIRSIDDNMLIESSPGNAIKARMKKMRYQSMRSLDDDYYEINMRVNNVDDEDEALYLMRQINTRLGIIDDYLNTEELDEHEKKKWFNSQSKFEALREKLSKATVYKSKTYGIYINYPDIRPDNY